MPSRSEYEVIIVGAGVAGVSLAYFLAERGLSDVLIVEREPQAAVHATGRSAASLVEIDPVPALQDLKILGGKFLRALPAGFSDHDVLERTGVLVCLDEAGVRKMADSAPRLTSQGMPLELLTGEQARSLVEVLDPSELAGAALLPEDGALDVHELCESYLRAARAAGAETCFGAEVTAVVRDGERCSGVVTGRGTFHAGTVVDAAGAWAGELARLADATPIPIQPLRRCAATFRVEGSMPRWPMVWSEPHDVYFKVESGGLLFSPMDEVPLPPCDPRPDDLVIAQGLERLRRLAPSIVPGGFVRKWAGLRTFTPDRVPAVGHDPRRPGYFWLAGQGGCGIETSPAVGAIAADLLCAGRTERFDASLLYPGRFA